MRHCFCAVTIGFVWAVGLLTACFADEPLSWGIQLHSGTRVIEIPSVASSGERIGAATVLPETEGAEEGTFVCRVGGKWSSKRVGPGTNPDRNDAECMLFVNLKTGEHKRFTGLQPAPDFVVQSPSGKYFALGSSVGWGLTQEIRDSLLQQDSDTKLSASNLSSRAAQTKLSEMLVGTVQFSVWESESFRPVWQMRYPDFVGESRRTGFVRPWEENFTIPIPWWAIDAEPYLYNYPMMAFSADEQFFVTVSKESGLVILNMSSGQQFADFPYDIDRYPRTFVFDTDSTISVLWSDGTACQVRLRDGTVLAKDDLPRNKYPTIRAGSSNRTYALFCPCPASHSIATVSGNDLLIDGINRFSQPNGGELGRLEELAPAPVRIKLSVGNSPVGIARLELSQSRKWAGISISNSRPSIEHFRFSHDGFTDRFERIDLATGKVVERIANLDPDQLPTDNVPTVNVASAGYVSSLAACLDLTGENIIYATPYRSESQ